MQEAKELSFIEYVKSHENLKACWVTSNYQQAREDFLQTRFSLAETIESNNPAEMKIYLKNGTEIIFATLPNHEHLRGRQIDYLGCSRLVDNEAYNQFIRPYLLGERKSIAIKASGVNAKPLAVAFSKIAIHHSSKEFEDRHPVDTFKQEYLGEFV